MGQNPDVDVVVIGAGEAGALVASRAVDEGHRVALAFRRPWGSTCLNNGCVPSKFVIHRANVAHEARHADRLGVHGGDLRVDLSRIASDKAAFVDAHRKESWEAALAAERLTLLEGEASLRSPEEVRVGDRTARAPRIVLATGMRPAVPAIPGLADGPFLTNERVMDLRDVPEHLVVLGGGYIGCELGQAYARFGATVTLVQRSDRLLPGEDPDVGVVLRRAFEQEGIDVRTGHGAVRVRWEGDRATVQTRDADGATRAIEGSHLLVATGRRPNTEGLGLDHVGVATDDRGFVVVDERLRTNVPGVWAIGDVNGHQPFTRVCQEEAKVAFDDAFGGGSAVMRREALPHAIFTDPEVGSVGMTAAEARAAGLDVVAGLVPIERVEKAELIGASHGFIKFVAEAATHRLLGCQVVGPSASDLVYSAAVVIRAAGRLDDLAMAVGVFPTLAEGIEGTARAVLRRDAPGEVSGALVSASHGGDG